LEPRELQRGDNSLSAKVKVSYPSRTTHVVDFLTLTFLEKVLDGKAGENYSTVSTN
jgi:hypothetical protein